MLADADELTVEPSSLHFERGNICAADQNFEAAIAAYDAALAIKPDFHEALYTKAWCYSLQGKVELALENLSKVIQLSPSECRKRAQTAPDFDAIRDHPDFKALLGET